MLKDLRYAIRTLTRTPGFSVVATVTLALGIGANTAVFALIRAVFFNPLPVANAPELAIVWERRGTSHEANIPVSGHEYAAWKEQNHSFARLALLRPDAANLTGAGDPESISILLVSADYFPALGIAPALGRAFAAGEDGAGASRVAILSDRLWRNRFGTDAAIIGRPVTLDNRAFTVIGVMPPLPPSITPDIWTPLDVPDAVRAAGRHNLMVLGRLAPGVTFQQAQADLSAVAARLAAANPSSNADHSVQVVRFRENLVGEFRRAMFALAAAVAFVLLIACVNVTNLLLTRGAVRHRELAVRTALGASRARLIRQLLAESLVVACAGAAAGLLLAAWIIDSAPAIPAVRIPLMETARLDWRATLAAAVLSLLAGVGAGLVPALRSSRLTAGAVREGERISDEPGRRRLRGGLVSAEIALTLVLLTGAALMINSFIRLRDVDPGFRIDRLLVFPLDLPAARYPGAADKRAFCDRLLTALEAIPGVEAAAATSHLPLGGAVNWMTFNIEGRPAPPPGQELTAEFSVVTPDYFRTMSIPIRRGRVFEAGDARLAVPLVRWFPQQDYPPLFDRPQPAPVAVISEAAARQLWPGEDPVGRRIHVLFSPAIRIVGVVGDVRQNALDAPVYPQVYLLHGQEPWGSLSFVVKAAGAPRAVAPQIRAALHSLDPQLPATTRTMDDVLSASIGRPRFYTLLLGVFGSVALALAIVGIFGVVSYNVAQRTREIGVRMALGAPQPEIVRMVVRDGIRPVIVGVFIGIAGALVLTRSIKALLFGVEPADPATFGVIIVLLSAVAFAACWIPARRATRVDPMTALRAE
jgi:putative ABC transport system permease protein